MTKKAESLSYGGTIRTITTYPHDYVSGNNFYMDVTGLSSGTIYHYRAYAANEVGISYGSDHNFTTSKSWQNVSTGWISGGNTTTLLNANFVYIVEGANIICTSTSTGPPTSYMWEASNDGVIFGSTGWINDSSGIDQIFTYPEGGNICIRLFVKKGLFSDSIMKCIGSMPDNNKDKYLADEYHSCKACEDAGYYWYNDSCHDTPKPLPWNEKKPLPEAKEREDTYSINLGGWKVDIRVLICILISVALLWFIFSKRKKKSDK